ncbi:translation initiation factor IF-1 [Burkholderia sp. FERM BP-3421]|uniref:translation initiation factor IF-1 n=1 Tax=Burkholderia sp. FERM BP-3421 TaxID=1494466 RepID=UPI0023612176|nr:translation initiation factor IF-1 [Burkholderia sp. FERM BP-3421]WDD93247.1 translation initiation factor IF-1 [Burkholderia sp. FERM BP-3421]
MRVFDFGTGRRRRELDGVVDEALQDNRFRVTPGNGVVVAPYASGYRVTPALSLADLIRGGINFRHKDEHASTASTGRRFVQR